MRRFGPMGALLLFVAAVSVLQAAYVVAGIDPSPEWSRLSGFALALAFVLWVVVDAHRRHKTPCYDFGFLVAVFFPASLVWYTVWSRGWRGLLTLTALLSLMLVPWLCAILTWLILYELA